MTKKEHTNHNIYLDFAEAMANNKSKCVSRQVGAVLVYDDRVIGTGINGSPPGYINCCDIFDTSDPTYERKEHTAWSKDHEIHAEINCVLNAAKNQVLPEGMTMYCTHSPCRDCLKNLSVLRIKTFYYRIEYDGIGYDAEEMKNFAKEIGIEMIHINQNFVSEEG
jgi:dCMP deaminase